MMRFDALARRPADWDLLIRPYSTRTLFHTAAWLDHVQDIHPAGKLVYYEIREGQQKIGLHCGLRIRKLGLPIHGSPLGGTGTNFMGPIVDEQVDQGELIRALFRLAGPRQFLHLELSHYWLRREVMEAAGFNVQENVTHLVKLPNSLDEAWQSLTSEARNRVRKAEKNGLLVERTEDPAIVDHFFEQFTEVYGKQGMVTPFGAERPRSLFQRLLPAGRLLPLWVRKDDEVLATGLFPYDDRCIYFWGAASWLRHQKLCPNEALHWGVIRFAVEHGLKAYNMCGGTSQFKNKFGGEDVPYNTYYRSALPFMATARRLYQARHYRSLRVKPVPAET